MAPKRKAGAKATPRATRAKSAAAASSDTVGIPELFKKVKADLQPDAKLAPQIQEKAALEPASVARSAADGAGGSNDAPPERGARRSVVGCTGAWRISSRSSGSRFDAASTPPKHKSVSSAKTKSQRHPPEVRA